MIQYNISFIVGHTQSVVVETMSVDHYHVQVYQLCVDSTRREKNSVMYM